MNNSVCDNVEITHDSTAIAENVISNDNTDKVENNVNDITITKKSTTNPKNIKKSNNLRINEISNTSNENQTNIKTATETSKINPNITLNNTSISAGKNNTFVAILPSDATGTAVFKLNNKTFSEKINVTSGNVNYTYQVPSTFRDANYTLNFVYSGDNKYESQRVNTTLSLFLSNTTITSKINPNIILNNTSISAGKNNTFVAIFPSDATGTAVFKLNNKTFSEKINVTSGNVNYTYHVPSTFRDANYTLNLAYSGDSKYMGSRVNTTVSLIMGNNTENTTKSNKTNPDIRLNDNPIMPGENATFIAILPDDATGTAVFKLNGKTISETINITSPVIQYNYQVPSDFRNANYTLNFVYSGDSKYDSQRINRVIVLTSGEPLKNPELSLNNFTVKYLSKIQIKLNLATDASGKVTFKLNRKVIGTVSAINGTATYTYTAKHAPKMYRLEADYAGDYKYNSSSIRSNLNITKLSSNIIIQNISSKAGSNTTFIARVMDELGNPVNTTVVFKINKNTIGNVTTNKTGYAIYNYILPPEFNNKKYEANAVSAPTKTVLSTRNNSIITLGQLKTRVVVPTVSNIINETITLSATVIDENQNNVLKGKVTFKINGKVFQVIKVSKGYATYTYKPSTNVATKYKVEAIYTGYWKYASSKNNGTININKVGTVTTARYVDAKSGNVVVLSADVEDKNQKSVNGGIVRFTLNGKYVGSTLVKNGAANLTYAVGVIPSGLYRLNATYMGSSSYLTSYNLNYMNVSTLNTRIIGSPAYVQVGKTATIRVTIIDESNHFAENGNVVFTLNGTKIGTATVHNGTASIQYKPPYRFSGLTLHYIATLQANSYYTSAYTINNLTVSSLNTVYVDSAKGNDNNLGDKTHPFKTLSYAVGHVATYGTVILSNGTYHASGILLNNTVNIHGTSVSGTIINGDNSGKPILTVTTNNTFVRLNSLTLRNGKSSTIRTAGAVVSYGKLNITNVKFISNVATGQFSGGAIYNVGLLNLTSVLFQNNRVTDSNGEGGALRSINNTTIMNKVWFTNNSATGSNSTGGGAIYFQDGSMVINNGSFNLNKATGKSVLGGAIRAVYGEMVITSSNFYANEVNGKDYGIGGAISSLGAGLSINNTKIQSNKAYGTNSAAGGGIYIQYAAMDLYNSNITSNTVKSKIALGGAIESYYGYCNYVNNRFQSNSATATSSTAFGGAIYSAYGNMTVNKCKFTTNTLTSTNVSIAGAIYTQSNTTITNSDFNSNKVSGKVIGGGAIANMANMTVTKTNFISNNASNIGNDITVVTGSRSTINNNYWGSKTPNWNNSLRGLSKPSSYSQNKISH